MFISLPLLEPFGIQIGLAHDAVTPGFFSGVEARISSFNQRLGGLPRMPMCNADREGDMPEVFTSRRLITSREVMALRKFSATVLASRRFVFGRMTANSSPA